MTMHVVMTRATTGLAQVHALQGQMIEIQSHGLHEHYNTGLIENMECGVVATDKHAY